MPRRRAASVGLSPSGNAHTAAALAADQQQAEPVDERIPPSYRNLSSKVVVRDSDGGGVVLGGSRPMKA